MPRPCKRRYICAMPDCNSFGPRSRQGDERSAVVMTVDEFECLRLIDLEGLTQEQCAKNMRVARTTVQAIADSAHRKLADVLVNARELRIDGGDYLLCEGNATNCSRKNCCRRHCQKQLKDETNITEEE